MLAGRYRVLPSREAPIVLLCSGVCTPCHLTVLTLGSELRETLAQARAETIMRAAIPASHGLQAAGMTALMQLAVALLRQMWKEGFHLG